MKEKFTQIRIRDFAGLMLVVFLLMSGIRVFAQPLMVDNFEYTIGTNLTDNGWLAHSGEGTEPQTVTDGLSFDGYSGTGVGGAALLDNNGEDVHRSFEGPTSGVVYASFMVNPTGNGMAGYFIHFAPNPFSTTYYTRVWINATGDGLGLGTAPETFVPITAGQTTLVVMKYDFNTTTSSLYVFNSFPSAEPATADAQFVETASISNVGSIGLRQFNAAEHLVVDGIRVATTWADAVAAAGGNPIVASPTFNPPAGNYLNPINVAITSSTAEATVYYSTSSATGPWTVYSAPVNVSAATTIWAYGEKAGYDNSPVASASYTFNQATQVATIAELRLGATDGTVYQLTGEAFLTFKATTRNQKYIQDATAAIMIDDPSGKITTAYNLYDGITGITGTLTLYNNMLEFVPTMDPGAATSTNNTVTPVVVTLSNLNDSYQAKLVKVSMVDFVAEGTFAASTNYDITDAGGTGVFRTQYGDLDYIGTTIPTEVLDVTGVVLQYQTTMQLVARSLADFGGQPVTDPTISSIILPQFIEGAVPNNNRVPFAYHASLSNLTPSATYRYYNKIVVGTDSPTSNGAGNCIFVNPATGTFTRTSSPSLATAGQYGEFTTDASGNFSGWFVTEPTGNASRFKPGTDIFVRIMLNDGANGTVEATRLTSTESIKVLGFYAASADSTGTAIRGISEYNAKNFVFLYDNTAGTGRPLYGTQVETSEVDFLAVGSYAAFYTSDVANVDGAWGGIIPNVNAAGVKRIEERSLTTGAIVSNNTSDNGVWGTTDTKNPSGGLDNVLVINTTLGVDSPAVEIGKIFANGKILKIELSSSINGQVQLINLYGQQVAGFSINGNSASYSVNAPAGIYIVRILNDNASYSSKVMLK